MSSCAQQPRHPCVGALGAWQWYRLPVAAIALVTACRSAGNTTEQKARTSVPDTATSQDVAPPASARTLPPIPEKPSGSAQIEPMSGQSAAAIAAAAAVVADPALFASTPSIITWRQREGAPEPYLVAAFVCFDDRDALDCELAVANARLLADRLRKEVPEFGVQVSVYRRLNSHAGIASIVETAVEEFASATAARDTGLSI